MKTAKVRLEEFRQKVPGFAKRSLGQNFLISDLVISKIIQAVGQFKPEIVIEVGPGPGALTDLLKDQYKNFCVIEMDRDFIEYWKSEGLSILEGDALNLDWSQFQINNKCVLVSNLPYQISSRLVIDRCLDSKLLNGMVLMFQKEVAQRIAATVDSEHYGLLSVVCQAYWKIETVADAGPRDFQPAPKVASRVLKFDPMPKLKPEQGEIFLAFVKASFAQRRKLLKKNLSRFKQEDLKQWFLEHKISETVRAEELTVEQFLDLFRVLHSSS